MIQGFFNLFTVTRILFVCWLMASTARLPAAEVRPLHKLSKGDLDVRLEGDARYVQIQREGLRAVISYVESRPDLFPTERSKESRLLRREEKEVVWNTWQRFLDYVVAWIPSSNTTHSFIGSRAQRRKIRF